MRRCRHPRRVAKLWSPPYLRWYHEGRPRPGQRLRDWVDAIVCLDCHAWLPLGPSRDTPETAIEVRAAEIAAAGLKPECGCCADTSMSTGEFYGWHGDSGYSDDHPDLLAGYLARTIAEHDGGKGEG